MPNNLSPSKELELLIACCCHVVLGTHASKLEEGVNDKFLDWARFVSLAKYHRIRPVAYEALNSIKSDKIPIAYKNQLQIDAFWEAMYSRILEEETDRLLSLFSTHSVVALPYKGAVFARRWYRNTKRECVDIDFFVPEGSLQKAVEVLFGNDYQLVKEDGQILDLCEVHDYIEKRRQQLKKDITFVGKRMGEAIYLELHWALYEPFYPYNLTEKDIFDQRTHIKGLQPSLTDENLFLMLLIHHGGREGWLLLKHLCDLLFFLTTRPSDYDWEKLEYLVKRTQLQNWYSYGVLVARKWFSLSIPPLQRVLPNRQEELVAVIVRFWEEPRSWQESLRMKWFHVRLRFICQDEETNLWRFGVGFIRYHIMAFLGTYFPRASHSKSSFPKPNF